MCLTERKMSRPLLVWRSNKDGRRVGPVVGVVGGVLVHQLQGERAPLRQADGQPGANVIKLFSVRKLRIFVIS